jgi:hypothetical protein
MTKKIIFAAAAALMLSAASPAGAQSPFTYQYQTPGGIVHIVAGQAGGNVIPFASPVDLSGNLLGTLTNPQAVEFGTGVLLPGFATPPTVNLGTIGPGATQATLAQVLAALGSPLQAGGSVGSAGSTGTDASANKPALPNVGANFAGAGPFASYFLVATVPASPTRNNVDVENTSGAQIAIVRDDGTASGGAAPVNASVFSLGGGAGAGAQGGAWSSTTFKGRLQIYAPSSGAIVAVMVD